MYLHIIVFEFRCMMETSTKWIFKKSAISNVNRLAHPMLLEITVVHRILTVSLKKRIYYILYIHVFVNKSRNINQCRNSYTYKRM